MKAIVAADEKWGIGRDGALLAHVREDMRFFKEKTLGKTVIMGRKTFLSLPGQQPLKDRVNIVLSRDCAFHPEGVVMARSLNELLAIIEQYDESAVFVIGGGEIYAQLLGRCDEVFVTRLMGDFHADTFFPDLDAVNEWRLEAGEERQCGDISLRFCRYLRA